MHVHIKSIRHKRLLNTRDLGGLPTADGRRIKRGKLIRSGKLYKLPEKTLAALEAYGVTTVIDLRIEKEREEKPDSLWKGVTTYHCPLLCTATPGITNEETMKKTMVTESKRIKKEFGSSDNYMVAMYRSILMGEQSQAELKKILRLIIDNEGCIMWHCSGGKDRAGIVSVLVEYLLGISEDIILADFLASRRFLSRKYTLNKMGLLIAPCSQSLRSILYAMMTVKPRYITEVIDEIKKKYGTVTEYCKEVLGVTDGDVITLKEKYLEG